MRYFFIDTLAMQDPKFYFSDNRPKGLGISTWQMAEGAPIAHKWPTPPPTLLPDDNSPSTKLPDLIGSTVSYLIVSLRLAAVIKEYCTGVEIEYLPIILLSNKKRPQSTDHCLVNPIGSRDCLNLGLSEIEYTDDKLVVGVDKFVLDPRKLAGAPALFRITEDKNEYVVNETLARAFVPHNFTNLLLKEIEVSAEDSKA
jgi:hypothetical protein